jgi:cardiolipin synthase
MTVLVAIPVYWMNCKVGIDTARPWSVVDELLLWAVSREPAPIAALAAASNLPRQLVVASLARMMRFRLVEVAITRDGDAVIGASEYGARVVSSGEALPFFPKRHNRRVSFTVERATGQLFVRRDVQLMSPEKLENERRNGVDVRIVNVEGGPPASHDANFARLAELVARGWDEQIACIDARTASLREDEFIGIRILDGAMRGLPEDACDALRAVVAQAAALKDGERVLSVKYAGHADEAGASRMVSCAFDPSDLVVGGAAHRECLVALLGTADRRVILHSTFLDPARFEDLFDAFRAACGRGVAIDILWGAAYDEETETRHGGAAAAIMRRVQADPDTRGRVRVQMTSTGSHSKIVLIDTAEGGWIAAVGSCNWLSSPFRSVEVSVVLRDSEVVAELATALERAVGRRGLSDTVAAELAVIARSERARPKTEGTAQITIVLGEVHERLMRIASGAARKQFIVGSHRLGATARPGAILPGEFAARAGVEALVLYTRPSGPVKSRDARTLTAEAATHGVRLIETTVPVHGKFLAWDNDDVLVTSLNWASASGTPDFPGAEIGVHVHADRLATLLLKRLGELIPELASSDAETTTTRS